MDIVILSDSKSSLQALCSKSKNRREMSMEIELLVHKLSQRGWTVSFQWIPSHCGIKGNEIVDQAAKAGAQLQNVTNNVNYTVSEIKSKIKKTIIDEWKMQYQNLAHERDWIVADTDQDGICPELTRYQTPIFYRLRGKTYRTQYTPQTCSCGDQLSFSHIFSCNKIIPTMVEVNRIADENNIPLLPKTLLTKHPTIGWMLVKAFIRELCQTDIGHLV